MGQVCVVPATVSAVRAALIPVRSASCIRNQGPFLETCILPLRRSRRPESGWLTARIRRGCEISIFGCVRCE